MWDLPRPGLEPASPALAGRFSITAPPGKPYSQFLFPNFFSPPFSTLFCVVLRLTSTDCIYWVLCVWLLDVGRSLEENEELDNYSLHSTPPPGVSAVVVFLCGCSNIFPCPCLFRPRGGRAFSLLLGPGHFTIFRQFPQRSLCVYT